MYERWGSIIEFKGVKYYRKILKPVHFMVKYQGFGISNLVINELVEQGVQKVLIIYRGVNGEKIYTCDLDQYITSSKTHQFGDTDYQKFVSVSDMEDITV